MNVTVQSRREGDHASLALSGPFDLSHAMAVAREVENVEASLRGCRSIDIDLVGLDRIDGAGAVLLARLLDRLDTDGRHASVIESSNAEAARLIALYREHRADLPAPRTAAMSPLSRMGALAAKLPGKANEALDLTGRYAVALPPATPPSRMIEPQVLEPQQPPASQVTKAANAIPVHLLDTQGRGHIGRRLLHQQPNGELTEDFVWRWTTSPDRYLDTALRLEAASSPNMLLVDSGEAPTLAATLLEWNLESGAQTQLVGAVEFLVTGPDRVVHTQVVRSSEPVSAELPGDLAAASGRLLRRLASEGLRLAASQPPGAATSQK
jgi:ABC-type transporter Mla MlaB component